MTMKWLLSAFAGFALGASAPAAFVPANPARVAEIAALLTDDVTADEPSAADRTYWEKEAATEAGRRDVQVAEGRLASKIAETTDALYLEFSTPGNGNRTHYERPYFDRERGLRELVRGECLECRGRFLPKIVEYLETLFAEKTWCMPAHDGDLTAFHGKLMRVELGSQSRGSACAWTLFALGDVLPEPLRARTRAEVERRILVPCRKCHVAQKFSDVQPLWWYQGDANWTAVCQDGTVETALMLCADKMDRAAFIEGAERATKTFLSGFTDDGYCSEGMGYWNYGWGHELRLALAVRKATKGRLNLLDSPKARKVMEFGFNALLCGTRAPSIADGGGQLSMEVMRLGRRLWPDLVMPGETKLPIRSAFPIAQMYVMRPGETAMPFVFGVKGGHNAEFHNHNDIGTYDLYLDNVRLAGDPGSLQYTALTFSARRYENPILSSYAHPVPVVNGQLQKPGAAYRGDVLKATEDDARDTVTMNLAGAYEAAQTGLKSLTREFVYDRVRKAVFITDSVAFAATGTFEVPVVTGGELVAEGAPGSYRLTVKKGSQTVSARVGVTVEGAGWHLKTEHIDNPGPGNLSPNRHAIVLDKPVATARVRVVYSR